MSDASQLLYLEPDDEITSVVRRLREADEGRVVLVASGRSKVTTSAVALRLLAGVAAEDGREIALVADGSGRALAAEAGIAAFASVAEARADDAEPIEAPPARRAPIRVVRGEAAVPSASAPVSAPRPGPGDETQAVPVAPRPEAARGAPRERPATRLQRPMLRRTSRVGVGVLVSMILLAGAVLAAVAPAATIAIRPAGVAIEPVTYVMELATAGTDAGELTAAVEGTATGMHREATPAIGTVTFSNYNTSTVRVAAGTQVAAGGIIFETTDTVVVPTGFFTIPGTARSDVVAIEAGPAANLPAGAIDAVLDEAVRNALRAFSDNPNRIVRNDQATSGGTETSEPEVTQDDVNQAVAAVQSDLAAQLQERLAEEPGRIYGPAEGGEPNVQVPDDLVGHRGDETFTLQGSLSYRRSYVERAAVEEAARERLLADDAAAPRGTQIVPDSMELEIGEVSQAGEQLRVQVTLQADAMPTVDADQVRELVQGMTDIEAANALSGLGDVSVELWPDWVERVPSLDWRIDVRVEGEASSPQLVPSASGSP